MDFIILISVLKGKVESFHCLKKKKKVLRIFTDSPLVRIPNFHCRGHRFNPWLGN